ncbi:MAG: tetratricopeptide repeat protein [Lewinellaceae bacterium]|nr:tetratricopeptide repeat protein [Lewinellaceae bacterium]
MKNKSAFHLLLAFLILSQGWAADAQIPSIGQQGTTRAVIIGISDYQNDQIPDLQFADVDAAAFAAFLQSDAGGKVPAENIRLLLNEKATKGQMGAELTWLIQATKKGDQAIIYFAGHGDMENITIDQHGFLLAYDATNANYWLGGAFDIIYLKSMVKTLALQNGAKVLLITDACRAGKLAGGDAGVQATAERLAEQFANEVKILSCQPNQFSLEGADWGGGRGLFSYYLINGLKGLADGLADNNKDLSVNLLELQLYLFQNIPVQAALKGKSQIPKIEGDLSSVLYRVNEDTLMAMLDRSNQATPMFASIDSRSRSITADTITHPLYRQFQQALDRGQLLYPEDGSAYALFQQMQNEESLQPLLNDVRLKLAARLQDDAQQAINDYIQSSPQEMARRWKLSDTYQAYPEYLGKAAALLGPDNFQYKGLRARQAYFEGLNLRLLADQVVRRDSLLHLAIQKQEEALALDSMAAYAYNELGLCYLRLKKKEEALAYFQKTHTLSPAWVIPIANMGTALQDMGKIEEAIEKAREAIAIRESYPVPHYNLGIIALRQGDNETAREQFLKAVQYDPTYVDAYYALAYVYWAEDNYGPAREALFRTIELSPSKFDAYNLLATIAKKTGNYAEAEATYRQALAVDPNFSLAYYNLGELYLIQNNYPAAEESFRAYLQLKPEDADGMVGLSAALSQQEQFGPALEWLEKALGNGYSNFSNLRSNSNFEGLRDRPEFQVLLERFGE